MRILLCLLMAITGSAFAGNKTIELNSKNTINFNQAFSGMYIAKKQVEAIELCAESPKSDIYIVLYSPGGSISAGKLYFDTLNALNCNFHTITIFSASMSYQTVQNLGNRYIIPSGVLMSHRASVGGLSGEIEGELDSIYNLIKKNVTEMEIVASKRVGISLKEYKDLIRDELWLTAESAKKTNHVDEIVLVKCGESLLGSEFELVRTLFGTFNVEFSKCPLITSPLGFQTSNQKGISKLIDMYNNMSKYIEYNL